MAIRSPQEMGQVQLSPMASSRLQATKAPTLDTGFIQATAQAMDRRQKLKEKQVDIASQAFDNDADTSLVRNVSIVVSEEGTNALESAKKQREVFRKELEERISKVSPELQGYFSDKIEKYVSKFDQTVIPHQFKETKKLEESIRKERIVYDKNDAIVSSGNLDAFNESLNKVYARTEAYAKTKYGEDLEADVPGMEGTKVKEIVALTARTSVSQTILGAIEQQAMMGNITGAKALGENFNAELTPDDRIKAVKVLEKAQNNSENSVALDIAAKASKYGGDNLVAQNELLKSLAPSTKIYNQAASIIRFDNTVKEKQKKLNEENQLARINEAITSRKFSLDMLKGIDPSKHAEILRFATNYNQGKFTETDDKTFRQLDDMIRDNPDVFASEINLMAYKDKLNDREFRALKMAQDRIRGEERGQQRRLSANPDRIVSRIFTEVIQNKQLWGKEGEVKKKSREFLEMILDANPKITPTELRKAYSKFMYDELVRMEPNPEYNRFWSPIANKIPLRVKTPEEIPVLQEPSIPEVQIHPSHVDIMKKRYPNASMQDINNYLLDLSKKGYRIDLPATFKEDK